MRRHKTEEARASFGEQRGLGGPLPRAGTLGSWAPGGFRVLQPRGQRCTLAASSSRSGEKCWLENPHAAAQDKQGQKKARPLTVLAREVAATLLENIAVVTCQLAELSKGRRAPVQTLHYIAPLGGEPAWH